MTAKRPDSTRTMPPAPNTARELLEHVAGEPHARHSVANRTAPSRGTISITCSCGERFPVPSTDENVKALRNVSFK